MNEIELLRNQVEALTAERDEYMRCYNVLTQSATKHLKELQIRDDCTSFFTARAKALAEENLTLQAERDAYAKCADDMAAAHKVERDGLTAANRDLQDWFDALKTDHDAQKGAVRLALDALEQLIDLVPSTERNCSCHINPPCNNCIDCSNNENMTDSGEAAIAALKAVL